MEAYHHNLHAILALPMQERRTINENTPLNLLHFICRPVLLHFLRPFTSYASVLRIQVCPCCLIVCFWSLFISFYLPTYVDNS